MPYASSKGQFQHGKAKHGEAKYGVQIAGESSPFTIITVLPLIQSAVGIILDSKNDENNTNYSEHMLPLIISAITVTPYVVLCLY